MFMRFVQPENVPNSEVMPVPISTLLNDQSEENTPTPKFVTLPGIVILPRLKH